MRKQILRVLVAWSAVFLCPLAASAAEPAIKTIFIDSPIPGLKLALHHEFLRGDGPTAGRRAVLFAEGQAVATSGNAAFRIDGLSFMDELADSGFDVWSLDYLGLGSSSRYPPGPKDQPVGGAMDRAAQVELAARFVARRVKSRRISLIGDSFGSLPAGMVAARDPRLVDALVLFAAITPAAADAMAVHQTGEGHDPPPHRYDLVTPQDIWQFYSSSPLPPGKSVELKRTFWVDEWGPTYLASDPEAATRSPPSVEIPAGAALDSLQIARGHFPYDPAAIAAPTLVINGEWDAIATDAGVERLFGELTNAKFRRRVVIGNGTHLVQYEPERFQLYREVTSFLQEAGGTRP